MTPSEPDVYDIAFLVGEALERISTPYFLGGSLASSLQGEPRATNDIDFVVDLDEARVPAFAAALGPDFDVDVEARSEEAGSARRRAEAEGRSIADAVRHRRSWNVFYLPLVYRIDLFQKGASRFDDSEFERRRPFDLGGGRRIWIKSPEDTVLRKLLWFREGGEVATHQWRDVVQVLRVSGLDHLYLDKWASNLGIEGLLTRAWAAARIP